MHCDVASGFNFKIEHFLHLNRVKREKVTLRYIINLEYNRKGLACLCSTIFCEPIIQENVASSAGVEKKQFVVHRKKRSPTALTLQR